MPRSCSTPPLIRILNPSNSWESTNQLLRSNQCTADTWESLPTPTTKKRMTTCSTSSWTRILSLTPLSASTQLSNLTSSQASNLEVGINPAWQMAPNWPLSTPKTPKLGGSDCPDQSLEEIPLPSTPPDL